VGPDAIGLVFPQEKMFKWTTHRGRILGRHRQKSVIHKIKRVVSERNNCANILIWDQ
jgi:hypothetical protein